MSAVLERTAGRSRSTSATRSWPSSDCHGCTRTTRCARCGRPRRCAKRLAVLNDELDRLGRPSGEPHRRQHRRGRRRRHHDRSAARHRRHRQRCRPAGTSGARLRGSDRRVDLPARARRRRGRAGRAAGAQGQSRTRCRRTALVGPREKACGGRGEPPGWSDETPSSARLLSALTRPNRRLPTGRVVLFGDPGRRQVATDRRVGQTARRPGARILRGRCLPYGRGITFWPLVEIVRERCRIARLRLTGDRGGEAGDALPEAPDVVARVASAIGLGETQLSARRGLLGHAQAVRGTRRLNSRWSSSSKTSTGPRRPFSTWLSTVPAHVAAPLLVVCSSRPELLKPALAWRTSRLVSGSTSNPSRGRERPDGRASARTSGSAGQAVRSGSVRRPKETRCSSNRWWRC